VTGQDAEARFLAWKIALQGTSDSLIFGLGHEGFRYAFAKYYDPKLYGREQWFDRAHNNYLDWLVQTGIIGLLAYLALWFFVFKKIFGAESCLKIWEKITLAGMFSAYAVFNLFSFDTVTASIIFFAFLSYMDSQENTKQSPVAEPCAARRREQSNSPAGEYACEATGALRVFVYCLITIIFLFIFYFVEYKPMLVARLAARGLNDSSPQLDVRLGFFKKAIALNTFATPEAREYLAEFAAGASGPNLSKESKSKIVDLVYSELSRQIESAPDDMRFPLRIGVVLNTYRYYAEAVHFIEKALALSPNKQPTMYELGTSFLNLGQYDKAVEIFKRAADLLPENEDNESKMLYVISLIYAHRFPEADSYTKRIFEEYPIIDSRVADAYRRVGQIQMASKIYAELERRKKERAQYEMTSA
jgi:tetratricopeptide (TPR) repeat protein